MLRKREGITWGEGGLGIVMENGKLGKKEKGHFFFFRFFLAVSFSLASLLFSSSVWYCSKSWRSGHSSGVVACALHQLMDPAVLSGGGRPRSAQSSLHMGPWHASSIAMPLLPLLGQWATGNLCLGLVLPEVEVAAAEVSLVPSR